MKYILLDTNVYLDLFILRTSFVPKESLTLLTRLVHFGDVKLILPDIIVEEIYRNLNVTVELLLSDISKSIEFIEKISFLNDYPESVRLKNDIIPNFTKHLESYRTDLLKRHEHYKMNFTKVIDNLCYSTNVIKVPTTERLLNRVLMRRIYKRCPFHKKEDAFADALLFEILIDRDTYQSESDNDRKIYFVTRNYKEFSNPELFTHC